MLKALVNAMLAAAGAAEFYCIWCVAAAIENSAPFPEVAWRLSMAFVAGYAVTGLIGIGYLVWRKTQKSRAKRLGTIRMGRDGRYYYTKK